MNRGSFFHIAVILGAVVFFAGSAQAQYLFDDPVNYPSGTHPVDVTAGDFNVDGSPDLASLDALQGGIHIFLNRGDGQLLDGVTHYAGTNPEDIETGFLNGDIYPDLVVSNHDSHNVSVFMGRGDGTFDEPDSYTVQEGPRGLCIADLDGDSLEDIAVVNSDSRNVSVLLNNGDGTFSVSGTFPSGGYYTNPAWIDAADLDQDGDMDLIVTKNYFNLYFFAGYVEVFFNDGDGGFTSVQTVPVENTVSTPIAVDLDGDDDIDVVVPASGSSYYAAVLRNPGNGVLEEPELSFSGATGRASAGDLDGDGDVDLIIAETGVYASAFLVVFNDGSGGFGGAYTEGVGDQPRGSTLADLDGDGDPEAVVAVLDEGNLSVLLNTTYELPLSLAVFSDYSHYHGGDSLRVDIVAKNHTGGAIQVQVWSEGQLPGGGIISPLLGPYRVTVAPFAEVSAGIAHRIPVRIPSGGPYTYRMKVGTYPDDVMVQDALTFFVDP